MRREYVKQHVVPQAYLKRFGVKNKNNKKFHICVHQNEDGQQHVYIDNIDNVAYIENYYDVPTKDDKKYWEHFFSTEIEPLYGIPLENVIAKITLSNNLERAFTKDDKLLIAKLICFQLLRVPKFLERSYQRAKEIQKETVDKIFLNMHSYLSTEQVGKLRNFKGDKGVYKNATLEHISSIENLNKYAAVLRDRLWSINYNASDSLFYTSDTPVIMININSGSLRYTDNGLGRADTMIIYPLTPKIIVQIYPEYFRLADIMDCGMVYLTNKDLRYINCMNNLQEQLSLRQAFSKP